MSDGVELHNLFPDPKPVEPATWDGQTGRIVTPANQPVLSVTRAPASRLGVAA